MKPEVEKSVSKKDSNKPQLIAVTKDYFDTQVEKQLDLLVYNEVKKDTSVLSNSGKLNALQTKLRNKAVGIVSKELRVKGTRTGHINHAPAKIQASYNEVIEQVRSWKWVTDGVDYECTILAKKVVEPKADSK